MSCESVPYVLSDVYERACRSVDRSEIRIVRRVFRRALRAASSGDVRPAILLTYRWS